MRRNLFGYAAIVMTAMVGIANAAPVTFQPITGSISIDGVDSYNTSTGMISFNGNGGIGADTAYGDFSPAFSPGCGNCVALTNFNYLNLVPGNIYSATLNNSSTSFELNSITSYVASNNSLTVNGSGVLNLTGFSPTNASFVMSTQGNQDTHVTFSATTEAANAVPEPASIALLGFGLLGLGFVANKKCFIA